MTDPLALAKEALRPFASEFAETFVDEHGWTGPMKQERIVDWFGPSDFRRAREALAALDAGGGECICPKCGLRHGGSRSTEPGF